MPWGPWFPCLAFGGHGNHELAVEELLWGLGRYTLERLAEGQAPMAPPNLGFVLVSFTRKFADILGSIACKLITLRPIFFHCDNLTRTVIFFGGSSYRGITRSKDKSTSRGSRSSYSRGDWRLPTLIFLSGEVSIVHAAVFTVCREASKTTTNKPPDHLESGRIGLSSKSSTRSMKRFLRRASFRRNRGLQSTTCNR